MEKTYDIHVEKFVPLISPSQLKDRIPLSQASHETVVAGRRAIADILEGKDPRLLVVTGPCSIHDEKAALDYAARLKALGDRVNDTMLLVMRTYFEKPRTTVGWKGLINDPWLNGSYDIGTGLERARRLLVQITEMGVPTATEMLDSIVPQYIAGLVCWAAIGARTTESQTHREMASGLSMPVGFKNCTDGSLSTAINAMIAARSSQSFLGIDPDGQACIVKTTGNPHAHIVLRGGTRPNYDTVSINEAVSMLSAKNLTRSILVDCSHDNSRKNHELQASVWQDVINQRIDGNKSIIGLMLESNLNAGNQKNTGDLAAMAYGVSITDACIDWETTEQLIISAHEQLSHANTAATDGGFHRYKVG
ncbi:phospho-2-dehydro-3-deoxyheptonate aldolase [Desulfosarcina ovata subsp. sediminis]|uniref:Phospho-2-dehydro-3-deoxyheptonate aldolase n=1 Tax=Desulfosarcina ovata subsp. sediminis TaxID=885957 RepID=A0A5K7ZVL4_9BACT|nr:3-deoxy-7-phosphoheptulonate synthase [Desulfosarcina ovata]BBO84279.1 phospho-2-dehydro-3-deoxyheptonate aldolase [Desulfosarcina ovata subsp. sediminis]